MSVRLGFAVAAHLDAEIMLIDEVLAVGDAAFQRKCMSKIRDLTVEEGRTIVFVSHNLAWVERLCDRVVPHRATASSPAEGPVAKVIAGYLSSVDPVQHGGVDARSRTTRRGSGPARRGSGARGCSTGRRRSRPARCCSTSRSCSRRRSR